MLIEKTLSELCVGHYVVEIAKQKGHFSLSAPGHIKSNKVITHLLNKKVESVIIDDSKTLPLKENESKQSKVLTREEKRKKLYDEVKQAREIFTKSKDIQKNLFSSALSGSTIDLAPVIEITNKSVDAIFNSPDSLACMVNIREKDEYLLEHSVAVSVYMILLARHLNIEKHVVEQLSVGAFLHDIGKIKIPDEILHKPAKLTDAEFEIMKTHANHSIDIIKSTPGIDPLSLEVAALHHEKLDGTGYPFQLKSEEITRFGRMISICDIFDALTASRVYKEGFPHPKAFAILRKMAKSNHLDAGLVDQFIKCVGVFPVGSLVQLNSNKLAIIGARNESDPTKPVVRSFYSVTMNDFVDTEEVNLSKTEDFIVKGVRAEEFDLDMNEIVEMILMQG